MADIRPEYVVARCCRTCLYYISKDEGHARLHGACKLPKLADPAAELLPAHGIGYCAAHIWRAGRRIQKIAGEYGMEIPEEIKNEYNLPT